MNHREVLELMEKIRSGDYDPIHKGKGGHMPSHTAKERKKKKKKSKKK